MCGRVRVSGGSRLATRAAPTPLHPPLGASLGSLCSPFSLIHTPTPACGVAMNLAPALIHPRGRVTPGVAGQAAVLSFSQPFRVLTWRQLGPFGRGSSREACGPMLGSMVSGRLRQTSKALQTNFCAWRRGVRTGPLLRRNLNYDVITLNYDQSGLRRNA